MTNREKYEAFRKLYGPPVYGDHYRFDKLVRLLLDLPETDESPVKVGEFWMTPAGAIRVLEATAATGRALDDRRWLRGVDADGITHTYPVAECVPVAAWNAPNTSEPPF